VSHENLLEIAARALQAIASGEADPQVLAYEALDQLGLRRPPGGARRFPVPLARSISTTTSVGSDEANQGCNPPSLGLVRTTSKTPDDDVRKSLVGAQARETTETAVFGLEVWSVDDACNKQIVGLRLDDTLLSLLEKIRDEFAVAGRDDIKLSLEQSVFDKEHLGNSLSALGIIEDVHLAFSVEPLGSFGVDITDLAGEFCVHVADLQPDMNLASLINAAEQEISIIGEECICLVLEDRPFNSDDVYKKLGDLGVVEGSQLLAVREIRPKGSCPRCHRTYGVVRDVTCGATHEGWGRRWNKCDYNCYHCGGHIQNSSTALNCCTSCKGFWHRSCRVDGKT